MQLQAYFFKWWYELLVLIENWEQGTCTHSSRKSFSEAG